MSVTPTVCITLAFWLGRGVRSCACAPTAVSATATEAAKGNNFLCNFISTSPRLGGLHLTGLDVCELLLEARGVNAVGLAARDGLLGDGNGLLLPVHVEEQIRLRVKVLEGLLDLDGLVNPLQSVLELVVVEVGFADGERHLPVAGVGRDRRVNLRAHERVNVRHLDRERHGQLLPAQDDLRDVRRHLWYL